MAIQETLSEHMAYTMHAAASAKQAAERRKMETQNENVDTIEEVDELPSKPRAGDTKYARIDSFNGSDDNQDPDLIAAITNRGQAPKQGDGNEVGPSIMNSTSKSKPSNNIDVLALAKALEKDR